MYQGLLRQSRLGTCDYENVFRVFSTLRNNSAKYGHVAAPAAVTGFSVFARRVILGDTCFSLCVACVGIGCLVRQRFDGSFAHAFQIVLLWAVVFFAGVYFYFVLGSGRPIWHFVIWMGRCSFRLWGHELGTNYFCRAGSYAGGSAIALQSFQSIFHHAKFVYRSAACRIRSVFFDQCPHP